MFDDALRMGADLADELESRVMSYGRWLLNEVFANAAAAALDDKSKNPIWLELVRRAGGPTLRIGKKTLYVALRLAAYDKRTGDQAWRGLDAGRKELLLPLRDDRRLRDAAQHVSKFNLTQTKTAEYVGELIAERGEPRPVRLTAPMLVGRMKKIQDALGGAATLRRVRSLHGDLSPAERQGSPWRSTRCAKCSRRSRERSAVGEVFAGGKWELRLFRRVGGPVPAPEPAVRGEEYRSPLSC